METATESLGQDFVKQPWELPAWAGDVLLSSHRDIVFGMQENPRETLPVEPLHIWEYPYPRCGYLLVLDPSSETHRGDPAAIQIVRDGCRQVAEMLILDRNVEDQLRIAIWLAEFYNKAILVPELNGGVGAYIGSRLENIGYRNLWRHPSYGNCGWMTTERSRGEATRFLQQSLKNAFPMMRSLRMRQQIESFTRNGPPDDDLIWSFTIAHYCAFNRVYGVSHG